MGNCLLSAEQQYSPWAAERRKPSNGRQIYVMQGNVYWEPIEIEILNIRNLTLSSYEDLEHADLSWAAAAGRQRSYNTGESYSGVNAFSLGILSRVNGYTDGRWMTSQRAERLGRTVLPGAPKCTVIKPRIREVERKDGEVVKKLVGFWQAEVYNACVLDVPIRRERETCYFLNDVVEKLLSCSDSKIVDDGYGIYSWQSDIIHLPDKRKLPLNRYYSEILRMLVRSTGSSERADRTNSYWQYIPRVAEEVIVELGAQMLGGRLGIEVKPSSVKECSDAKRGRIRDWLRDCEVSEFSLILTKASEACEWLYAHYCNALGGAAVVSC